MTKGDKLKANVKQLRTREREWRSDLAKAREDKKPKREIRRLRKGTMTLKARLVAAELRLSNFRRSLHTPMREKALANARALVGVMEHGGNNTGPVVDKIIRANDGMIGEPWCGDFVAYCYERAGSKAVQRAWAAVVNLGRLFGMHPTSGPKPGDIVCFSFDHTGLFEKDLGGGQIQTIEGNTGASGARSDSSTGGDGVYVKVRSKSLVSRYVRVTR